MAWLHVYGIKGAGHAPASPFFRIPYTHPENMTQNNQICIVIKLDERKYLQGAPLVVLCHILWVRVGNSKKLGTLVHAPPL